MNRIEFEALRDIPDKQIRADIRFSRRQATAPALIAEGIAVENSGGVDLRLNITFNPAVGSKPFNAHVPGVGPICRLDVDGPAHRPAGRSHKHALQTERCPDRNLPDEVVASGNTSQAHALANEIFRRWYDLDIPARSEQRVTVFDDRFDVYRTDDLRRLRDLSTVVALSDRQTMKDLLTA